jgi:hypothetical protein
LSGVGPVRPLVESMMWIFTGNHKAIEASYAVDLQVSPATESAPARWQLSLTPKHAPLTDLIRELRVEGSGRAADRMELEEISGDRTVTRIFDAKPRERFNATEQHALFGTPAP